MRLVMLSAATLSLTAAVPQAQAQSPNGWRVSGIISGRTFALNCRLEQRGGICTDAAANGRSHPLTSLSVTADQARWSFITRVLIANITLNFTGRIAGGRMSGVVTAGGRTGSFTAVRS